MARMSALTPAHQANLPNLECPSFETTPWAAAPSLANARVAIVSSAGLVTRGDRPVPAHDPRFRVIPDATPAGDVICSHASVNFDRTGYLQDLEVILPRQRLHELAESGEIASVARNHYSFMGATEPTKMKRYADEVARLLAEDDVNAVLFAPV